MIIEKILRIKGTTTELLMEPQKNPDDPIKLSLLKDNQMERWIYLTKQEADALCEWLDEATTAMRSSG